MKGSNLLTVILVLLLVAPVSLAAAPPEPSTWVEVRGFATATAPDGVVWLVWSADDGTDAELFYSRWDGRTWSSPQTVYANPSAWDDIPSLTIGPDGTVWVAWTASDGKTSRLLLSHWTGRAWSEPEQVPINGMLEAKEPFVAAAPDGEVWLAWVGFDGTDDEILVSHWNGRSWSTRQVSENDGERGLYDRQPRLAVGQDGHPWLVWTGHQSGVDNEIYFSRWTGRAWTPEQMLSTDDDQLDTQPALALDAQGRPWVAWEGMVADGAPSADGEHATLRILVSRWDAYRSAWTAEAVASSALAKDVREERPALALDRSGGLHLAWVATSGGETALAQARWLNGAWTAPELVRGDVNAYRVALAPTEADSPLILWDDPAMDAHLPVQSAPAEDTAGLLSSWIEGQLPTAELPEVDSIPNRLLAFGDSITWGQYPVDHPTQPPFYPYPSTLEDMMDVRVMDADVVNVGSPGEGTGNGADRIKDEVEEYRPKYVLIMEGTNNVSHNADPADIKADYLIMIDNARKHAGVKPVKVLMGTIIPRLDDKNDETEEMNEEAVIPAANEKGVPVCDHWTAFYDYGVPLADIYWDEKHPNQEGLNLFANSWYNCLTGLWLPQETQPPTAWISSLPAQSNCGQVNVSWTGSDNLTPVGSLVYDVQMNVNSGPFGDWMMNTQQTSGSTFSSNFGDVIGFQVRARDLAGNLSSYSAPAYTTISDSDLPEAQVNPLPQVQLAPFTVSWSGSDACSDVVAYLPQYRVGAGAWQNMLPSPYTTPNTSASFNPGSPQYGETYYFRVQAKDQGDNWSLWSNEVQTKLARFTAKGHAYNLRHQPVAGAQVDLDPPSAATMPVPGGGFAAYLAAASDYDFTVARNDLYGSLPTMWDLPIAGNVTGLEFVLPPQDDAVTGGGFEAGDLDAWQVSGSTPPTLTTEVHTGLGAVKLGGAGEDSHLSQMVVPELTITSPTLSFMVRLEAAGPSAVEVELSNSGVLSPPVTFTLEVDSIDWSHAWFDLEGLVGEPLTLTLTVSDSTVVLVDEISLGSSLTGGWVSYVPLVFKQW